MDLSFNNSKMFATTRYIRRYLLQKKTSFNILGCPKKNIPIDPPKLQFLTYTFEISVVGRHFHSGFSAVYGLEKF